MSSLTDGPARLAPGVVPVPEAAAARTAARTARRSCAGGALWLAAWAVLLAGAVLGWPVQLGGHVGYTVVSGHSMEPTYHTGDLLLTRKRATYRTGDVVVYRIPAGQPAAGYFVVHRLVAGSDAQGWTTRGDNNPAEDIWYPHDVDIQGSVQHLIPDGGKVLAQSRNPLLYALLGGLYIGKLTWPRKNDGQPTDQADT